MKSVTILLTGMVIILTGCSSLHQVDLGEKEKWMPAAQEDLMGEEATVTTMDGHGFEGKVVRLNTDSLWLKEESSISPIAVHLNRVSSIRPSRNVGAPLGGFLGGALVGGLIGGAIGANKETEYPDLYSLGMERVGNAVGYGMIGAAVGAIVFGVTLGLATSVTDYRIIQAQSPANPRQAAPTSPDSTRGRR
ncbi:MAG: hypothetical protein H6Q30_3045 [Bacteroidetes bacterium]|nr:hypothetical protein [Bacteroidota bacterium]